MIELHISDEHAPFPHRFISTTRHIVEWDKNHKNRIEEYDVISESVICALCGHWTQREVTGCNCRASCHTENPTAKALTEPGPVGKLQSSASPRSARTPKTG